MPMEIKFLINYARAIYGEEAQKVKGLIEWLAEVPTPYNTTDFIRLFNRNGRIAVGYNKKGKYQILYDWDFDSIVMLLAVQMLKDKGYRVRVYYNKPCTKITTIRLIL